MTGFIPGGKNLGAILYGQPFNGDIAKCDEILLFGMHHYLFAKRFF